MMNSKELDQMFSLFISTLMNVMGYSYTAILTRRKAIEKTWLRKNLSNEHMYLVLCGSLAEGIIPFNTRDLSRQKPFVDVFGVTKNVIGTDDVDPFRSIAGKTLFGMDRGPETLPGHAILKIVSLGNDFMKNRIEYASKRFGDSYVLSSQMFLLSLRADKTTLSIERLSEYMEFDRFVSFQCFCPSILSNWRVRNRTDWPPEDVIRMVVAREGILVPSRDVGSANNDIEWRISFSKAEKLVSASLNVVFQKVYVLLRMLFSRKNCDMSSYLLKTAVFWVAEKTPSQFLDRDELLTHTVRVLVFLKMCLTNGYVPNYFNPSWNVMTETGTSDDPENMIVYICCLIEERGQMCLRIDGVPRLIFRLQTIAPEPRSVQHCIKQIDNDKQRAKEQLDDAKRPKNGGNASLPEPSCSDQLITKTTGESPGMAGLQVNVDSTPSDPDNSLLIDGEGIDGEECVGHVNGILEGKRSHSPDLKELEMENMKLKNIKLKAEIEKVKEETKTTITQRQKMKEEMELFKIKRLYYSTKLSADHNLNIE